MRKELTEILEEIRALPLEKDLKEDVEAYISTGCLNVYNWVNEIHYRFGSSDYKPPSELIEIKFAMTMAFSVYSLDRKELPEILEEVKAIDVEDDIKGDILDNLYQAMNLVYEETSLKHGFDYFGPYTNYPNFPREIQSSHDSLVLSLFKFNDEANTYKLKALKAKKTD